MDDGVEDAQLIDVDETTPLMEAELRLFEHDKKTLEKNIYMPERHKFLPVMNRVKKRVELSR